MQSRVKLSVVGLLAGIVLGSMVQAQEAPKTDLEGYAWAAECQGCHEAIYDAWSKTKHSRAIDRLNAEQRQAGSQCIGCHVSGSKEPIMVDGTMVNANIQCEGCHGPGKAHAEAAKAGNPKGARIVREPPESMCEACHNKNSPHYRGFFYTALKGLVHRP